MSPEDRWLYRCLLEQAHNLIAPIFTSITRTWSEGDLTYAYPDACLGPLDLPDRIPVYALDPTITVKPGAKMRAPGFYLPNIENAPAAILLKEKNARAKHGLKLSVEVTSETEVPYYEWA